MKTDMKKQILPIGRRDFLKKGVAAGLGLILLDGLPQRAEAVLRIGDIPPKMALNDLNGKPVNLPIDFKGKVSVLHFWASWCTTCRSEIAILTALHDKYGEKELYPCSIDVGETKEAALSYIRDIKVSHPILLDPSSSTARQFGVSGIPTFYLLNRENVIRYRILGEISRDGLERIVRTLL
jgi:cytochrome c biogenesis protein CcmG/thiol:disulfide interchange protein DsbE